VNVEQELRWFFSEAIGAAGELGMKSSFEAFEGQCLAGAGNGSNAIGSASAAHDRAIRALPAASRWRAIADVLHRLSHDEQRILRAAHEDARDETDPVAVALVGAGLVHDLVAGARRSEAKRARLAGLRAEAEHALARSRFAFWRGFVDLHEAQAVLRRRPLTADLESRLRGVA